MESNEPDRSGGVEGSGWLAFPGGELEGERPKVLCASCRDDKRRTFDVDSRSDVLCFQCYRAAFDREQAFRAAGRLDTASETRFRSAQPFEPLNRPRLAMLRAERGAARTAGRVGAGEGAAEGEGNDRFAERRHQAQIAARGLLRLLGDGLGAHRRVGVRPARVKMMIPARARTEREQLLLAAIDAAELQWPESWLPFVVANS